MTETEDIPQNKTLRQKLWNIAKLILKVVVTGALLYYVFSKVPLKYPAAKLWWCNPRNCHFLFLACNTFLVDRVFS